MHLLKSIDCKSSAPVTDSARPASAEATAAKAPTSRKLRRPRRRARARNGAASAKATAPKAAMRPDIHTSAGSGVGDEAPT
jgi:hypothetical protein